MLDLIYGQLAGARRRWFEQHPEACRRLRQPVISVGNLSVGGTGKTPLVAQIAGWLAARGEHPAILSRGYRRRSAADGVTVVADKSGLLADVDRAGDEPLMLARQLPGTIVCVAEDRHLAGVLAERVLGATAHVLDDGFQHIQLARDFDILVTAAGEITQGRIIPRGRLRERKDAAARADFVVVVGADRDTARAEAWELGISAFSGARRVLSRTALSAIAPSGASVAALGVAGIGRPEQFFSMLKDAGVALRGTLSFSDHHCYSSADIQRIEAARQSSGATVVVTTEKDAVRLDALGTLPFGLVAVPMRLEVEDWDVLAASLEYILSARREVA